MPHYGSVLDTGTIKTFIKVVYIDESKKQGPTKEVSAPPREPQSIATTPEAKDKIYQNNGSAQVINSQNLIAIQDAYSDQ